MITLIKQKIVVCLLGIFITCFTNCLCDDQELFNQANELYKKGDFAKAYDLYAHIKEKSPIVHYNLGNCAYKLKKFGYALVHWRRAERDWGFWGREELLNNIELVKQEMSVTTEHDQQDEQTFFHIVLNFFKSLKSSFISLSKAIQLFHLQLFVLFIWLILFTYLRYLYRRKKKILITVLFLLQAFSASMLAMKYSFLFKEHLVVLKTPAFVTSGPGSNFATLGQLSECQEAAILKESENYYKIRFNGSIGWIDKKVVEKI